MESCPSSNLSEGHFVREQSVLYRDILMNTPPMDHHAGHAYSASVIIRGFEILKGRLTSVEGLHSSIMHCGSI